MNELHQTAILSMIINEKTYSDPQRRERRFIHEITQAIHDDFLE